MTRMVLLAVLYCGLSFSQQVAFTSRAYVQSPVLMSSIEASKEYGFDSVMLRNDGPAAITAVHFRIMMRAGTDEEVADERRVAVRLDAWQSKRVTISLGHAEGLRQQAKSRKQAAALAILTIESVEFEDGGEWRQTEQKGGNPFDPVVDPPVKPRK